MRGIQVEIYGATYTIRGDAEPEYVRRLARFVDEGMRAVARRNPSAAGMHKIAVLAALNIADELHRSRDRQRELERMVEEKTLDLLGILGAEG